jgi:hypothetical protein
MESAAKSTVESTTAESAATTELPATSTAPEVTRSVAILC